MYKSHFHRLHWTRAGLNLLRRVTEIQGCIIWSIHRWIRRDHRRLFRCFLVLSAFLLYLVGSSLAHSGRHRHRPPLIGHIVLGSCDLDPWEVGARPGISREAESSLTLTPQPIPLAARIGRVECRSLSPHTLVFDHHDIPTELTRIDLGDVGPDANARKFPLCSRCRTDWIATLCNCQARWDRTGRH